MIPVLYESEHISIQTIWVMTVIALLISSYLAVSRLKRKRVNFNLFISHSTSFLLSALLLSRVVFFFSNWTAYFPAFNFRTVLNFISIWDQGFSFWGGIFGFLLMLTYRIYKEKEQIWKWYDALIVPILVGMAIGNIGAFLGGVSYGRPTNMPWGVTYESYNVKYTVAVHPSQIYAILGIIAILWSKKHIKTKTDFFEKDGNTTLYLTSGLSILYFIFEFFKGDDTLLILGIRLPIFLFFGLAVISSHLLYKRYKSFKHESI